MAIKVSVRRTRRPTCVQYGWIPCDKLLVVKDINGGKTTFKCIKYDKELLNGSTTVAKPICCSECIKGGTC